MSIYCAGRTGPPPGSGVGTGSRALAAALVILSTAGCDIEWGGASFSLQSGSAAAADSVPVAAEEPVGALPLGPLLYLVRTHGAQAYVIPVARLVEGSVAPLETAQAPIPEAERSRFDSTFLAPGTELALMTAGRRVGSVVLGGPAEQVRAECTSVAPATVLVLPEQEAPATAFAVPLGVTHQAPRPVGPAQLDPRVGALGPVLAETLLRETGETRPFSARPVALEAVWYRDDSRPALVATYLINDALEDPPVGERDAVSLFYVARFEPARGYVPAWSELRRYDSGADREVYTYLDAVSGPAGWIDFVIRHDAASRRLAASRLAAAAEERSIDWVESARCPGLELLEPLTRESG